MSIPVQTPFNLYIANGSTTVFPYRFLLNQASDLRVTANGKVIASGFSVSGEGNPSGGQITFSRPPESGTKISILRNIPLRRDTEYQDNGDLLASTINADFDRLWMAVQGVDAATNLALSRSGQDADYYDAKGMPVANLKDPVSPQDAVTKKVLDAAVARMGQQVQDAKTHLDEVWQSVSQNAVAAKQSEANSATSEQQAAQHAQSAAKEAATTAATETTSLLNAEFNRYVNRAEMAATNAEASAANAATSEAGAQQALEEAKLIAKTPGRPGKDGAPGINGKSAYEIWKEQQSAGTNTSVEAYIEFQKGKAGGISLADIKPGGVGSVAFAILFWSTDDDSALSPGDEIDGERLSEPTFYWTGDFSTSLPVGFTVQGNRYTGTWIAMQATPVHGIGLFVRKR